MSSDKPRRKRGQPVELAASLFLGFDTPESNFFRMPNNWTDITASIDSLAELKLVEYVLRHTWGFHEYGLKKHITMDEFVNGRRRSDGSRFDKGTGLSERAVHYGLAKAVADGLLEEEVDDSDRGRVKKWYGLKMRQGSPNGPLQDLQPGVQSLHPPLQNVQPRGARIAPRTEKETLERNQGKGHQETTTGELIEGTQLTPSAVWQSALEDLKRQMSGANFETYIRSTRLVSCTDRRALIEAQSGYQAEWLNNRFTPLLRKSLSGILGFPVELEILALTELEADHDHPTNGQHLRSTPASTSVHVS